MPLVSLSPEPILRFVGNDNLPLVGGKLYSYQAGTQAPLAAYTDSTGQFQHANPITLNSRGEVAYDSGVTAGFWIPPNTAYKLVLRDALNNQLWSLDNIQVLQTFITNTSVGAVLYPVTVAELYAGITRTSPQYPSSQGYTANVWAWFTPAQIASCIAEDVSVDHTAAIQAANDFLEGRSGAGTGGAPHPGGTLFFPGGLYNMLSDSVGLRIGGNVTWKADQNRASVLNFNSRINTGNAITLGPDQSGFWPWSGVYTVGSVLDGFNISLDPQNQFAFVIATSGAHQFSHIEHVLISGFNQRGIQLGGVGGPANFYCNDIDMQAGTLEGLPAPREGFFLSTGSLVTLETISVEGGAGHPVSIGIRVNNGGICATNLHFENAVDGVYFDNQASNNCSTSSIDGISGNSSVTNLVHIPNPCNQTVIVKNVTGITGDPANPVAIKNEVTGEALLNTNVSLYCWSGDSSGARAGAFGYSAIHNTPHIRYGKSVAQAIAQNTFTALTFPTKLDDSFNVSEWSGSVYTPKIPGRYRVTVSLAFASQTWTAGSIFRLYILKNGATQSTYEDNAAVGTFVRQLQHTDTVNCVAGDTISTGVLQGIVASLNTDSFGNTCYIAIDRE